MILDILSRLKKKTDEKDMNKVFLGFWMFDLSRGIPK